MLDANIVYVNFRGKILCWRILLKWRKIACWIWFCGFSRKKYFLEKILKNEILTYHNIGCLGFIFVFGTSFRNWKFILGRDCSEYQNRKNFDIQKIVMTHIIWVICMSHQSKMISICWEAKSHCMNSLCQETRIILIGSNRDEQMKSGHFRR